MNTFQKIAAFAALSLSLVVGSGIAMAGEKGEHSGKSFPMAGAEFKQHVDARIEKHRAKMESHIAAKKVSEEKATEIRNRFNEGAAKINAEVDKAIADGTVTKEEAKDVHKVARQVHKHHGKGGKGDKKAE